MESKQPTESVESFSATVTFNQIGNDRFMVTTVNMQPFLDHFENSKQLGGVEFGTKKAFDVNSVKAKIETMIDFFETKKKQRESENKRINPYCLIREIDELKGSIHALTDILKFINSKL
jgi:hypothetical protein